MLRWLLPLVVLLGLGAPALAEVGTCLRPDGVRVAPFTDPVDPACGEDCGPEGFDGACGLDGQCLVDGAEATPRLAMPAPAGPRCLEATADCEPFDPSVTYAFAQGVGHPAARWRLRPPRLGLLPGAGEPFTLHRPHARGVAPESPPPRRA